MKNRIQNILLTLLIWPILRRLPALALKLFRPMVIALVGAVAFKYLGKRVPLPFRR